MSLRQEGDLSLAILKYLTENPQGMDTLQGIARYWVLRERIEDDVKDVEKALTELVEQGYIIENEVSAESGGSVGRYYRLNDGRLQAIQKLLENSKR